MIDSKITNKVISIAMNSTANGLPCQPCWRTDDFDSFARVGPGVLTTNTHCQFYPFHGDAEIELKEEGVEFSLKMFCDLFEGKRKKYEAGQITFGERDRPEYKEQRIAKLEGISVSIPDTVEFHRTLYVFKETISKDSYRKGWYPYLNTQNRKLYYNAGDTDIKPVVKLAFVRVIWQGTEDFRVYYILRTSHGKYSSYCYTKRHCLYFVAQDTLQEAIDLCDEYQEWFHESETGKLLIALERDNKPL
jgi:hypothetical protein